MQIIQFSTIVTNGSCIFDILTAGQVFFDVQRTFLIELFNNSKTAFNYSNLGMCLERFIRITTSLLWLISPSNKLYINKAKIFHCHEAGSISDEMYETIIKQLGGQDKFFDPSLKLVISEDIDPVVKNYLIKQSIQKILKVVYMILL